MRSGMAPEEASPLVISWIWDSWSDTTATRPTMPMTAPVPPPPDLPGAVDALDATDPAIPVQPKLVVGDRATDPEGPTARGSGPTLPAPVRDKLAHDDTGPTPKTDGDKPAS